MHHHDKVPVRLADHHVPKPDVCFSGGDASANAHHQPEADGLERRSYLCRYRCGGIVANPTSKQKHNRDVVSGYRAQGVQVLVVVGRVAVEVVMLFLEHPLGGGQLDGQCAHPYPM
jgi:hypothetical protein